VRVRVLSSGRFQINGTPDFEGTVILHFKNFKLNIKIFFEKKNK